MKYWTNVVIEGHCLAEGDTCPCGRTVPSPFCLGNGKIGTCPHFGWSDTTERNAAFFVPLRLILLDRFKSTCSDAWNTLEWFFWGQLWLIDAKWMRFLIALKLSLMMTLVWHTFARKRKKLKLSLRNGFLKQRRVGRCTRYLTYRSAS